MLSARKSPKRRATRRPILSARGALAAAASREIYRSGFQSASLDTILTVAGVTKGALYYHFDSKEALGHAVVDEVIAPESAASGCALYRAARTLSTLDRRCSTYTRSAADVRGGCQLNNLAQEMSPLDAGFRKRLAIIFDAWRRPLPPFCERARPTEAFAATWNPLTPPAY